MASKIDMSGFESRKLRRGKNGFIPNNQNAVISIS